MRLTSGTRRLWWRKVIGGALLVLGLGALGLPGSQAQMHYSGGLRPSREGPPPFTNAPPPRSAHYDSSRPSSISPDNDYYPSFTSDTAPASSPSPSGMESRPPVVLPRALAAALPWNQAGFEEYQEVAAGPLSGPKRYALETAALAGELPEGEAAALLIFHLPEDALLWVEGKLIPLKGQTSTFRSPALSPGTTCDYTVRVAWLEGGLQVSQTRDLPVRAGSIAAIYLGPSPAIQAQRKLAAQVEAALAKLSPEDREAARKQRYCVVRMEIRLGETGVPVKVMVGSEKVFVCSKDCVRKAMADPQKTLAQARELRGKSSLDGLKK